MIDFLTGIERDVAFDVAGRVVYLSRNESVSARSHEDSGGSTDND
jgi:hypothetical protein